MVYGDNDEIEVNTNKGSKNWTSSFWTHPISSH